MTNNNVTNNTITTDTNDEFIKIDNKLYLDDMYYDDRQEAVQHVYDIADRLGIPIDLAPSDALNEINKVNKKTKTQPPSITFNRKRPAVTDLEVALIQATYYTTPLNVIAHVLSMTPEQVKTIHKQTEHTLLPSIPLVMITDTSRYLSEDKLNVLYDDTSETHLATQKELLRIPKEEQKLIEDTKAILEERLKGLSKNNKFSFIEYTCTKLKDIKDIIIGLYGEEEYRTYVTSNTYNIYKYPYNAVIKGYTKFNVEIPSLSTLYNYKPSTLSIAFMSFIQNYLPTKYDKESFKYMTSLNLNTLLNRLIQKLKSNLIGKHLKDGNNYDDLKNKEVTFYNPNTDITSKIVYKSILKSKEHYHSFFNKSTNTYTTYCYERFMKPYFHELPYAFNKYINDDLTLNFIKNRPLTPCQAVPSPKKSNFTFGVRCLKCNAFLSDKTTLKCQHITITIDTYKKTFKKRKPMKYNRHPMVQPFTLFKDPSQKLLKELQDAPSHKHKYSIKTSTQYDYLFKDTFKDIITIYIDQTDAHDVFELYITTTDITAMDIDNTLSNSSNTLSNSSNTLSNPYETLNSSYDFINANFINANFINVTPLYTNFSLPIVTTQEPSSVSQ